MAPSKKTSEREAREARERLRRFTARQAVHDNQIARRKRDNVVAVGAVVVVAALATVAQLFYFNGGPGTPTPAPSASASAAPQGQNVGNVPDPGFGEYETYTGSMTFNDSVTLEFTLDTALAPQAGSSILADSTTGYFVGKTCHRLVQTDSASLLQCGSLNGDGLPDPTYSFGPIENAPVDGVYLAGTIAMARGSNDAYSNGRQFFIVLSDTRLPGDAAGGYSVVGRVTSGLDSLVAEIGSGGIVGGATDGAPVVPTTITAFTIQ